ncbi:hypothetical protein KJY78_03445 [Canibacter sp. lx-45]|uniref:hypothetical protein n=1 Tax=Canibacter zhuwentaonis TaxID=2837491 RepID=UPI001BDD7CFF|nr:hypothetical protein [Canibacter zhuwentaonis]MBT1035404.1 hypothetical protein [Canibacter zhuwentaonis]
MNHAQTQLNGAARVYPALALEAALHLVSGLTVLFTAVLHENLTANRAIFAVSLAVFAVARLLAQVLIKADQKQRRHHFPLAIIDALAVFITFLLASSVAVFSLTVILWALGVFFARLSVLVKLKNSAPRDRNLLPLTAILAGMLAVFVFIVRTDQVSVIGAFGGYGVIIGIFGLIAAFDTHTAESDTV